MRRRGGWWLVLGLLLWSCSAGGVRTASETSSDDGTSASDSSDSNDVVSRSDGTTTADPAGVTGPPLPGLLDLSDEPVPNDGAVRTGTLANGLVYYVRQNDNPGAKADLRLAIRAGSVDELGADTGVAHFAEHMLFNGTEKFPENELIDTLRSFGAAFGADVNAYTTFDETVYTLTVPNAEESVETGLNVLEQWLSHATFEEAQVVAERGVVLDEWRVRTQSTRGRLFDVAQELFLSGSPYEGRSPIGTQASIESMPRDTLTGYYDTWYRPDNAAIVVVGDIVVDEIVADLERLFGPAAGRAASVPTRPDTTFEVDLESDVGLHVDPDQQTVDVEVTLPLPAVESEGTLGVRAELIDAMIYDALVRRLRQDLAAGTAPFDDVTRGGNSLVDSLDAPALYAFTDAARVDATLVALLDEYERAFRFGFTPEETDLARETIRAIFDARFEGRESNQDSDYASTLVEAFLDGAPYPSIPDEHAIATATLDAVTPDALAVRFAARWTNSAPHVIISAPEAVAGEIPNEAEVLAVIADTPTRDVSPRGQQRELPEVLMLRPEAQAPLSVESVVPQGDSLFDPVKLVYPNGTTVILNTNTIVEGQVFYQGASPGGSSLVADDDVVDALYAADIVTSSGLSGFNQSELAQITAGTDAAVSAWIDPYVDHFAGSAATADLEVLLQQLHLYMTQPRVDTVALNQVRSRVGPVVADPSSDARAAGDDALLDTRYPGELRYASLPLPAEFETLDTDGVDRVWRSRYGDASDWVFVFSGDFDMDTAVALTDSYLGTLPGSGQEERWIDVGNPPPPGVSRAEVTAGTGDTATVTMLFTSPIPDIDARLRVTADVATELIQARLTDVIREQLGESYSPSAVSFITTDPDPVIETFVFVTGSPDRITSIADLVVAELDDIGTNGPSEQEFFNAFAQVQESLNFVNNGAFVQELVDAEIHPQRELEDYLFERAELDAVSSAAVQQYVDTHMAPDRYIQVTVEPR
ncbi:M16 family metallopeptidase [Ilumatobacter sp.]|uniref:M16 family metallopeptidase n=1 Tax=Ilumatobacter sp. TaxID=1967498 RepID=UPI003AF95539